MENVEIRLVKENEYNIIDNVVRDSFFGVFRPGCVEHFIVNRARENNWLVKAIDFCITLNKKIIGHIMFSHANIVLENGLDKDILVLGPVCILPEYQKQGFGTQLINYALSTATKYQYGAIAVVGNPKFFARFGFVPAKQYNIYYSKLTKDQPAPFFMIKELQNGYLDGTSGVFEPTEVFSTSLDEVEQFDKQFTPKEKSAQKNKITIKI